MGKSLRDFADPEEATYWQLVAVCRRLSEAVTLKYVNLEERAVCRERLARQVQDAIASCSEDFRTDYRACNSWHDEYRSVTLDCDSYAQAFPEETITGAEELEGLLEEFPCLEPDQDYDHEDYGGTHNADLDISDIFTDL